MVIQCRAVDVFRRGPNDHPYRAVVSQWRAVNVFRKGLNHDIYMVVALELRAVNVSRIVPMNHQLAAIIHHNT